MREPLRLLGRETREGFVKVILSQLGPWVAGGGGGGGGGRRRDRQGEQQWEVNVQGDGG